MEGAEIFVVLSLGSFVVMISMIIGSIVRLFVKIKGKFNVLLFVVMFFVFILSFPLWTGGFWRARASGQLTACESNMKNIGTAIEMYAEGNGGHYPPSLNLLTPAYLLTLPKCPSTDEEYGYTTSDDLKIYTVYCSGKNAHTAVGLKTGFPQYSSEQGLILKIDD